MKLLVCSVFDSKVNAYMPCFLAKTKGEAIRLFSDACLEKASPFFKHPSDFRLFVVGTFDDNNGMLTSLTPEGLLSAGEVSPDIPF